MTPGAVIDFSRGSLFFSLLLWLAIAPIIVLFNRVVFALRIEGRENLECAKERGCILVSNHSLYLDPAIVGHSVFPRRCCYSAMRSHFANPVFASFIRLLGAFPVTDGVGVQRIETAVREALRRGRLVHYFPEGKMTHLSQAVAPFRSGAFHLALRLGLPVVPVTLVHRPRTWFGRQISRRFIRVKSIIGSPVVPERGADREEADRMAARVRRIMVDTINAEHGRASSGPAAPRAR